MPLVEEVVAPFESEIENHKASFFNMTNDGFKNKPAITKGLSD